MDKMLYTAAQGASRIMQAQTIAANNLANADTPGFKADLQHVAAMRVDTVPAALPTRVLAHTQDSGFSSAAGVARATGRTLDLAIRGDGMFTVQTDAGEAYTRHGGLVADANGQLTIDGRAVVGVDGPIVLPAYRDLFISDEGMVSVLPDAGGIIEEVGQLKLVNPQQADIRKAEDGLFYGLDGNELAAANDQVRVDSGVLESSNVGAVNELIAAMDLSRQFEVQVKLMKSAEKLADAGNRLLRDA
ncbi:flagellar basal body rod protein FlgF [Shewanella sp. GXUN23E]|uniref:flagellar basal body rod protein FlgF n=1 Tax=Shewanella sp. GXUN23E TaxID=3422498 RepID=UPI003D7CFEAF